MKVSLATSSERPNQAGHDKKCWPQVRTGDTGGARLAMGCIGCCSPGKRKHPSSESLSLTPCVNTQPLNVVFSKYELKERASLSAKSFGLSPWRRDAMQISSLLTNCYTVFPFKSPSKSIVILDHLEVWRLLGNCGLWLIYISLVFYTYCSLRHHVSHISHPHPQVCSRRNVQLIP